MGSTRPLANILEYDSVTKTWTEQEQDLLDGDISLPAVCYIFLDSGPGAAWYMNEKRCPERDRRKILERFKVPGFLGNNTCTNLNGYFGSKSSYEGDTLDTLTTWFRILTKRVLNENEGLTDEEKDYRWYEMGVFTHWKSPETCRILCIDTPKEMRTDLTAYLKEHQSSGPELKDPFSMLVPFFNEVVKLCDDNNWQVTKAVRKVEKERAKRPSFQKLRELARHTGHLVEVHQVAIDTMERLAKYQERNFTELPNRPNKEYKTRAMDYLAFQLQALKSLKMRAMCTHERLQEEINLAYNMLASSENTIMKSITLLTMVFLPSTFVTSLFSTTFFAFEEDGWKSSDKIYIYFVVVVPLTIIVLLAWWLWIGGAPGTREKWLTKSRSQLNGVKKKFKKVKEASPAV